MKKYQKEAIEPGLLDKLWDEYPAYPIKEWGELFNNNQTTLHYHEWVAKQLNEENGND